MADRAQNTTILGAQFFRRLGGDQNPWAAVRNAMSVVRGISGQIADINQRVTGLQQDRQRARENADHTLGDGQRGRCCGGGQGDLFFVLLHLAM